MTTEILNTASSDQSRARQRLREGHYATDDGYAV